MRTYFRTITLPKRFVKAVQSVIPELKHSQAQELTARLFGYRDWHELAELAKTYEGEPTDLWASAPRPSDSFISRFDSVFTPGEDPLPEHIRTQVLTLEEFAHDHIAGRPSVETLRLIYQKAYGAKPLGGSLKRAGAEVLTELEPDAVPVVLTASLAEMVQRLGPPEIDPFELDDREGAAYQWHFRLENGKPLSISADNLGAAHGWLLWTNRKDRAKVLDAVLSAVDAEVHNWLGYRPRGPSHKFLTNTPYEYSAETRAAWDKAAALVAPGVTFIVSHDARPSAQYRFFVEVRQTGNADSKIIDAKDENDLRSFFEGIIQLDRERRASVSKRTLPETN